MTTPPAKPPRPTPKPPTPVATKGQFEVDLPAGGRLQLQNADEVQYWDSNAQHYIRDYGIVKANDLVILGALLTQGLSMFRGQQALADPKKASNAMSTITKAAEEITRLEKQLGIDKKTREAGGQHTVTDYVTQLKRAAHEKGVHIAERVKAYEAFAMELRWKIRLLRNGDDEDRAYHNISDKSIVEWAENELAKLEDADKKWAHEKGKVFVGRL
jgi:hypothetical protein